jgi:Cytochrome c554 and c-prime
MGNAEGRLRRRFHAGRYGALALVALVLAVGLIAAAPAFAAFVHPPVTDVTQCFTCHPTQFNEWKATAPYPSADGLTSHNVTMAQTLTNSGHNTDEPVTGECVSCHSPFSAKHQDLSAWTAIGELVGPLNQVGLPKGVWTLKAPYKAAVATSTPVAGFYFPAQHSADTTHAAWEGISCRVCHDTSTLRTKPNGDQVPSLRFFAGLPTFAAGVTPSYAYVDVANTTALCESCHQAATDDSRTAPAESVHAGIPCATCHMTGPDGKTITHSLSAGKLGAALATTACNQCHAAPGNPAGHPDVTTLDTSFKSEANLEKYGADPSNLTYSADARRNLHFLTCDSCHPATANATTPTVLVYNGTPQEATFNVGADPKSSQFAPLGADDASHVFVWTKLNAAAGSAYTAAPQPLGVTGTYTATGITQNTNVYFTQATAAAGAFPGLGRGTLFTVTVKVKATLKASAARVKHGNSVVLTATLAPNKAGKKVLIQKSRNGKSWTTWKTLRLTSTSAAKAVWTAPSAAGKYYFRASYKGDSANAGNTSVASVVIVN